MHSQVKIPFNIINPLGQSLDEQIYWLAQFAVTAGARAETDWEYTSYTIQTKHVPLNVAQLVVSKWGDVHNYPVRIRVSDPKANTPYGDEPETREQWSWSTPMEFWGQIYISSSNGNIYRPLSEMTESFADMVTQAELVKLIEQDPNRQENV